MFISINRVISVVLFMSALVLAGCGGGGGGASTPPSDGNGGNKDDEKIVISRIEVHPSAMLLTEINDTKQLKAQAYDANDQLISNVVFTWFSNDDATISVDNNGSATAQTGLGSAQITATAEGIESLPVTALVALPIAGAVLIDDAEVVVPPTLVNPNANLQLGMQFVTTLDGVAAPQIGETIVGTGAEPIGGVVVNSETQGDGTVIVTYELAPLDQLFSSLLIEETYDLSKIPFRLGRDAANLYDLEDLGGGAVRLTLKPEVGVTIANAATINPMDFKTSIFECETTLPNAPFVITRNPGIIDLTAPAPLLSIFINIPNSSVKVRLDSEVRAEFKVEASLSSQLTSEVKCAAPNLVSKTVPVLGPMFVISPTINIGPTIALGGDIKIDNLGFVLSASAEANGFIETQCLSGKSCEINADINTPLPKADFKINVPNPSTLGGLMIQPVISAGVTSTINFGLPPKYDLFGNLSLEALSGGLILKQTGDLALIETQALNETYASNFNLAYEWEAGVGKDLEKVINFINTAPFISIPVGKNGGNNLAVSPMATGATEADTDFFITGETVTFTVNLDPTTINYPFFGYNVNQIIIYREDISSAIVFVTDVTGTAGQTEFNIPWVADHNGSISGENYYAFVTTNALPVPYIGGLELGNVIAPRPGYDGFAVTQNILPYGSNYSQACKFEFGASAVQADWNQLASYYSTSSDINAFMTITGFSERPLVWVTKNGLNSSGSTVGYVAQYLNHAITNSVLFPENIDNYFFGLHYLDSSETTDANYFVLCDVSNI